MRHWFFRGGSAVSILGIAITALMLLAVLSPIHAADTSSANSPTQLITTLPADVTEYEVLRSGHLLVHRGSPRGRYIAITSSILDPTSGRFIRTFRSEQVIRPIFNRDATSVLVPMETGVEAIDPRTWITRSVLQGSNPLFNWDGTQILLLSETGECGVYDASTGALLFTIRGRNPQYSPYGRYIGCDAVNAQGAPTGYRVVYDASNGEELQHTVWNRERFTPDDAFMWMERTPGDPQYDLIDPRTGDPVRQIIGMPVSFNRADRAIVSAPGRPSTLTAGGPALVLIEFSSGNEIREITAISEADNIPIGHHETGRPFSNVNGLCMATWSSPTFARNGELLICSVNEYHSARGAMNFQNFNSVWIYDSRSGRLISRFVGFSLIGWLSPTQIVLGGTSDSATSGRKPLQAVRVVDLDSLSVVHQVDPWPGPGERAFTYRTRVISRIPALLSALSPAGPMQVAPPGVVRLTDGATLRFDGIRDDEVKIAESGRFATVPRRGRTIVYDLQEWREIASLEGSVDFLPGDNFIHTCPTGERRLYRGAPSPSLSLPATAATR